MSDVSDGSGQIPRRGPRGGSGGAPVSGALAIVLAVIAVVAGFLILRSISDDGESALDIADTGASGGDADGEGDDGGDEGDVEGGTTVPTLPPTTTQPEKVVEGALVLVANANGVGGSASQMSRAIEVVGFTVVDPVNASAAVGDIDESRIYYDATDPVAQAVAETLARELGGDVSVAPMPDPAPTADGTLNGAGVLLMLGNDKAGKTLAELAADATVAVVVTNPDISGSSETTTG